MIAQSAGGIFFVDRSLGGRRIVEALRLSGASAIAHDEEFPIDATDEKWLEEAGRRRWLVLTKDNRITRRTLELLAIARAEARVFVLGAGNMTSGDMAAIFVGASGRMQRLATSEPSPFIARVQPSGRVRLWMRRAALRRLIRQYGRKQ